MGLRNLFIPAANDMSLQYLYRLFGDMNGLLGGGQSTAFALFGELFRTFNTIALTVGTLIVVYTTIVGVLKTAVEGEFLGKHWSSLWIPLRMVLGIAALVPTPSGYSGLQIIMMWVIMQGVGAADQVWSTALRYVSVVGSPYTQSIQIPTMGVKLSLQNLFVMLVCDRALNQGALLAPAALTKDDISYDYGHGGKPFSSNQIQVGTGTWTYGSTKEYPTACGKFTIEQGGACPVADGTYKDHPGEMMTTLQCRVANAQVGAVKNFVAAFEALATQVINIDRLYQAFYIAVSQASNDPASKQKAIQIYNASPVFSTVCDSLIASGQLTLGANQTKEDLCTSSAVTDALGRPASLASIFQESAQQVVSLYYTPALQALGIKSDFIQTSTDEYGTAVAKPVNDYLAYLSTQIQEKTTGLNPAFQQAENSGWIFAGAYYMLSQSNNAQFSAAASTTFNVNLSNLNDSKYSGKFLNVDTATFIMQAANQAGTGGGAASVFANSGGPGANAASTATQTTSDTTNYIQGSWGTMLTQKQTDPLVALQSFGYALLLVMPIYWLGFLGGFIGVSFLVSLSPSVLGNGFGAPGSGPYWTAIVFIFPVFLTLLSLMIGVGGLIGVYTPFIPYIIFITGGLGWLLSIVEMMVAGPLVALGILAPGGQHDVLGKAEPALGLLFANFLRPTLMIFGMFAAMLLAPIALDLLNGTFSMALTSIAALGVSGSSSVNTGGG